MQLRYFAVNGFKRSFRKELSVRLFARQACIMSQEKMLFRRRSGGGLTSSQSSGSDSQQAGASLKSDSQNSHFSPSGVSQDFFEALNFTDNDIISSIPEGSDLAQSIGIVPVLCRPSTNKRQKEIKPFALQKCFYACPKNMSEEQKNKVKERIDKDIMDFKFQKYNVELHRFGLPFVVEEICCVSAGYNLVPKILKAPVIASSHEGRTANKRRRIASDDEDDNDDEEDDYCVAKTKQSDTVSGAKRMLRSQKK